MYNIKEHTTLPPQEHDRRLTAAKVTSFARLLFLLLNNMQKTPACFLVFLCDLELITGLEWTTW